MNRQEEEYFAALSKHRSGIADVLDEPAVRGYKDSVVEKYSDQAHFIYELLQNADDAHATQACFVLEKERLIFTHNGSRHFSVTDPNNEEIDSRNKTLGDINSITSIANSNKERNSIGKFGVGFKAVFQYTSTPHIYDPNFKFKIERFIVPIKLDDDFPGRKPDETMFVFPFDHPERDAKEAYNDISNKLRNLSYPLLFLTNLKYIEFQFDSVVGLYGKEIKKTNTYGATTAELVVLTQNDGDDLYEKDLWLFSRQDECERRYSVGFFMDAQGQLTPVHEAAFCFFPTKEVTNLNFIVHAPFLLTDSREGIRAGETHNDKMIARLAELAADSLEHLRDIGIESGTRLIDDNIVSIIPTDESNFSDPADRSKVSFLPFYQEIENKFENSELLPSMTGYVSSQNAYWAEFPQLPLLFSNAQLADITDNENAQWVFVSYGHYETNRNNKALCSYIEPLVRSNINEDVIINGRTRDFYYNRGVRQNLENIKGITIEFIEKQSFEWLHAFYKWLSETKHRTESITVKPIFLDQDRKAVAAFDENEQLILFLPVNVQGYRVVHPELLKNEDSRRFIESIGVKEPDLKDQIYNIFLPLYKNGGEFDSSVHFMKFFNYYCKCSNDELDDFIELIKECKFLTCYEPGDEKHYRECASSMYLPNPELLEYFETKPDTRFVAIDKYRKMVGPAKEQQLLDFLAELGIHQTVSVQRRPVHDADGRDDLPHPHSTRAITWEEPFIDGCNEILKYITEHQDESKSVILWNALLKIIEDRCSAWKTIDALLNGTVRYFYYTEQNDSFESLDAKNLKNSCWLENASGEFVSPSNLNRNTIASIYDTSSEYAEQLMDFLEILDDSSEDGTAAKGEDDSNLTDEQRAQIALANKMKAYGIENADDLEDYLEYKRQKEAQKHVIEQIKPATPETAPGSNHEGTIPTIEGEQPSDEREKLPQYEHVDQTTADVINDILRRTKEKPSPVVPDGNEDNDDADSDELIPASVDYSKKIERAKEKSAAEIDRITCFEELHNKAAQLTQDAKYSVAWFQTLMEMESLNSGEDNTRSREVSISFAKVEREAGTKRTLVLMHPNQYIPQFMEDLADIPLVLHMGSQTKQVAIEVANIRSYTLRVKMKSAEDIADIDLSTVTEATIDAKSPAFLLEELRREFKELNLAQEYNMKDNLCENIEFIFGPPGTGKTTHLARKVLLPLMQDNTECKVLVLTPTNKAADVLVRRIMEISDGNKSYEEWLVRFGATGDEEIEQSPVYRDKSFDIRALAKNVTVTTIARFPYDFFMPKGARISLKGINWDYIVIDEASMIPLANIIYPLYKKTPKKFIIAGDPFQIEPITSVDLWKDENIYKMVELDSFSNPVTKPHAYKVELLTTQYRSVPNIGTIFSNFAYGGILKHYRSGDSQRQLHLGTDLNIKTLNIIKFPVSKYESIYRCKRLKHSSSYQVYSALFTYEYVCYLSRAIADNNPGEQFRIGVIAPYRAQADLIDKLLAAEKLPKDIDVQVGTIHGFQGDECDIIFAVFNTPPTISSSQEMFLNKKNIINVSISRARDYLFVVMPDDNTENINNLQLVKKVENLIQNTDEWGESASPELENLMFGDPKYLENNAFSTSHQPVNVYGLPEKTYEVRTEDAAVDVQVHKAVLNADIIKTADADRNKGLGAVTDETEDAYEDAVTEDGLPDSAEMTTDSVYEPDEAAIPLELRAEAIIVPVKGFLNGPYFLVPYLDRSKAFKLKNVKKMYIPLETDGQKKKITVFVVAKEHILFIMKPVFLLYQKELMQPEGIRVQRTYYK